MRNHALPTLAFCGLLALPVAAQGQEYVIHAGKVLLGGGVKPLAPGKIHVKKGKIVAVAADIKAPGVKVLDHKTETVAPGLINAYRQLGIAGGTSEYTREVTPDFNLRYALDWRSRDWREVRAAGETTVCIAPGTENVIAGVGLIAKTAGEEGARVLSRDAGLFVTMASDPRSRNSSRRRPDSIYVRQPTNRMGVVWLLRSNLSRATRTPQAADARLKQVLAGKRRLYAVSRTRHDLTALLRIADEFPLKPIVVGGQEAHRRAAEFKKRNWPVILGPLNTRPVAGPEGTEASWNHAGVLHQAGVTVALSGPQLLAQARFAVRFGLPPSAALAAITSTPAKLLGISDRVGAIAPGKDADLVLFSGDPWEFTTRIRTVIIDGVAYREGKKVD